MSAIGLRWRSRLYRDSTYLIAANAATAAFGLLFWTAASRLYEPRAVGLAAATVSVVTMLGLLSTMGLDYAVVRFLPGAADAPGIIASSVTLGAAASTGLALVFIAGLDLWAPGLAPLRQSAVFVAAVVAGTIGTTFFTLFAAVFLARGRADLVFWQAAVLGAAKFAAVLALAVTGGAVGLTSAWALALVGTGCCTILAFIPRTEGNCGCLRPAIRRKAVAGMASFAFANYVALVLWTAPTFLLPLLVMNIIGAEASAYFYVAWNIAALVAMIPVSSSLSLFAHGSHDDRDLVRRALANARFALWFLVPATAAVWAFGDRVLLLFGRAYAANATGLLRLLALSALPITVTFLLFGVRRVQRRMRDVVTGMVWMLGVTFGASAVLLPRFGLPGVGIAWLAAQTSLAAAVFARYAFNRLTSARGVDAAPVKPAGIPGAVISDGGGAGFQLQIRAEAERDTAHP